MMCSRFLKDEREVRHGRVYMLAERFFDGMLSGYRRSLGWVLRHQPLILVVFFATMVATVYLYVIIPKGFFPQQDTGLLYGQAEAGQDISFKAMTKKMLTLAAILESNPDIESFNMATGTTGANSPNVGRFFINLTPHNQRASTPDQVIDRLKQKLAKVEGVTLYLQSRQDINVGGRLSRTQYQYTLQDADLDELNHWAPLLLEKLRHLPELQDVATDQQTNAATVTLTIDRDTAARFGILPQVIDDTLYDAFGQRQVTQYFTQLSQYHVVLEVTPELQTDPAALDKIYVKSPITGQEVRLSAFVKVDSQTTSGLQRCGEIGMARLNRRA
jgi:HAE1 family hydrophobic/amphiphilic exporter-1/multidrug efflux pump